MAGLTHYMVIAALVVATCGTAAGSEEGDPAASAPAAAAAGKGEGEGEEADQRHTREAIAAITAVLEEHELLLSADEASTSDEFQLEVRLSVATRGTKSLVTDLRVARRGDRVAIVVAAADGLPYCLLTNGLLVVFDRDEPGRLAVLEGGSPVFVLEGKEGEVMDFTFSHQKGDRATVRYDPESLLRAMLKRLRNATYDGKTGAVMLRTDRARVLLSLPPQRKEGAPALDGLAVLGASGTSITVTGVSLKTEGWDRVFEVTRESVEKLGIPTRAIAAEEARQLILVVPPTFGSRPAERRAAETLKPLLRTDAADGEKGQAPAPGVPPPDAKR